MKKSIAVVLLSAIPILYPAAVDALTLYTPIFACEKVTCSIVNVSKKALILSIAVHDNSGKRIDTNVWSSLFPGQSLEYTDAVSAAKRCTFLVRRENLLDSPPTRSMVRAGAVFKDITGNVFAFEAN